VNFRDGCGSGMDSLGSESDLAHLSSSESDLKIGFNYQDLPHSSAASLFCYATTSFSSSGINFPDRIRNTIPDPDAIIPFSVPDPDKHDQLQIWLARCVCK
jgi:hypothetical protein